MRIEPLGMERAEAEAIYGQGREAVVAVLLALSARIAALEARIAKQEERIAELERRLARNSRNSSMPPSQDPPSAPERRRAPSSKRSQGAQPGHPGHGRRLAPIEALDEIVDHWPEHCACGHRFSEAERCPVGKPARHQVTELPAIAVIVTEHRLHRLRCPDCGAETRAELPPGCRRSLRPAPTGGGRHPRGEQPYLPPRHNGANARALRRSHLAGSIDAIVQRTAMALRGPYEELLCRIRAAPAINVDETGWRTRGGKRTLWGVLSSRAALFRIAPDRHEREAKALLGVQFAGIACSDRWWAYNYLGPERRQLCWAHLRRDFTAHSEGLGAQKEFG